MLDRTIEIGLLFDYYGQLLTERQQKAISLYFYEDLSLGEIAERLEISRQGVYDHLHRGEKLLRKYEQKLGLIEKEQSIVDNLDRLEDYIREHITISPEQSDELKERIARIKSIL
ncbi:MAG: YlxM family DNA-binding protein [Bacillota bacterium]